MDKSNYHMHLGTNSACTKRMAEVKKGIGQRDIKRATKNFLFLMVGSLQISRQNQ